MKNIQLVNTPKYIKIFTILWLQESDKSDKRLLPYVFLMSPFYAGQSNIRAKIPHVLLISLGLLLQRDLLIYQMKNYAKASANFNISSWPTKILFCKRILRNSYRTLPKCFFWQWSIVLHFESHDFHRTQTKQEIDDLYFREQITSRYNIFRSQQPAKNFLQPPLRCNHSFVFSLIISADFIKSQPAEVFVIMA